MATYVTLMNFTEQGARDIKGSPARYEAFKSTAEGLGLTVKSALWTVGAYDVVMISEGSEEAMMKATLKLASQGNVKTQTLRAFNAPEMRKLATG